MAEQAPDKITPRAEDYSRWYLDVIRQAGLAEPAEVVKGCMVIKPHGYAIWEKIQRALDDRFKETGHQNAYFPLLIPESFIKREAEHVEGFSPELAVVTIAGGQKLEEPYVIRPTSETIIGHFFGRWIQSWRDLPMLINQWANVMRWELRTRMFLRTGEFLWQEGHTAHATHAEAVEEVKRMLDIYAEFAEGHMAMPVVRGVKTDSEKFAGALQSFCIEAMMQDNKALQAGTSHDLGQNFGKAFDVKFQNKAGLTEYVWQTSWGVSTRLIGALIMTHSDDNGLVLPPKLAPVSVAIVPIFGKGGDEAAVREAGAAIEKELKAQGLSVVFDVRDHKPGFKYFEWEQKGVPLRLEIGPKDLEKNQVAAKDRLGTAKEFWPRANLGAHVKEHLDRFQTQLFDRAKERRAANTVKIDSWSDFKDVFAGDNSKFVLAHWDGSRETEAKIKEETKVTIRCIPFDSPDEPGKCVHSGKPSPRRVLFSKSY
ncbi:MAG: proline--tRNA ligase [Deltaproteobacteria bacterium]|nr:proline--tRNA ligase [Deltaproteobacteria bacterium]